MATFSLLADGRSSMATSDATGGARAIRRRLGVSATLLVLYLLYGQLYDRVVASAFAFGGFVLKPVSNAWLEVLLVAALGWLLPTGMRRTSDTFIWLSAVLLLVPAAVLSAHEGVERSTLIIMFGGVALVRMLCRVFASVGLFETLLDSRRRDYTVSIGPLLAILFTVLILLAIHVRGALSFSFQDVYDIRFVFNASLSFPLNYLLPFAAGPLAGCITAMALEKKGWVTLGIVVACGMLFFGLSSHKALMFNPPFVIIGWLFVRQRAGGLLLCGLFAALTVATLLASDALADLLGASFGNRLVFIPAQIHYYFFREFADIGYQYWAESRFSLGLSQSRLPIDSVNYIGLVMAGDASIGANTGWIANGYMNGGPFGIAFYALILSITLHVLDTLGRRYSHSLVAAAFLVPVLNIVNATDLLVGFLTGGLLPLIAVFLLAVRPRKEGLVTVES